MLYIFFSRAEELTQNFGNLVTVVDKRVNHAGLGVTKSVTKGSKNGNSGNEMNDSINRKE